MSQRSPRLFVCVIAALAISSGATLAAVAKMESDRDRHVLVDRRSGAPLLVERSGIR